MKAMKDPLFDLEGKAIVVAGAAGGLGSVLSRALAQRGARLILGDIDEARLAKLATDWPGDGSLPPAHFVPFDIRDAAATDALVCQAVDKFGAVDGALNAAGVLDLAPALELSESAFRHSLDVNVTGSLLFSRAAAKAMRQGGRIVHLASVSSFVANTKYAAYASAKAALAHLVRVLAREWAPAGITVNAIGPAMIETPMIAPYLADSAFRAAAIAVIPMGRLAVPEDLIGTTLLLLCPAGAFITGQTICVDGGRTLV
jgi:NAD(P)-dependent dehydrogenase (short-subunit alcohol dehydrogenase family)